MFLIRSGKNISTFNLVYDLMSLFLFSVHGSQLEKVEYSLCVRGESTSSKGVLISWFITCGQDEARDGVKNLF